MIEFRIDREKGKLLITYPEHSKIKDEVIDYTNNWNAMGLWRLRIRSYIMNILLRYCKSRSYALAEVMTIERQLAIKEIRATMLANYEGKNLEYFLLHVMKLSKHVVALSPGKNSSYLNYYQTVILPMFYWINAFLRRKYGEKS